MAGSSKSIANQHIRSISFPSRSHPSILRIEEELNKVKSPKLSALSCLSGLEDLYKYMDEFLNLTSIQKVLSQNLNEKWVDGILDGSVKILDICSKTLDIVSQMKEYLGDVHSCLRRRKGDSSIESSIAEFNSFRKKMKKDAKRTISALKHIENETRGFQILDLDQDLQAVIRVIREVSSTSNSIFQTLLIFLSVPVSKSNQTKWSLISNIMRKSRVACEDQVNNSNDFERLDAVLFTLCKCGSSKLEEMQIAQNRLETVEGRIEEIENGLEFIFRRLIKTRSSLLNIFSY